MKDDKWITGRPWVELYFAPGQGDGDGTEEKDATEAITRNLRHSRGLTTRWDIEGLNLTSDGPVSIKMAAAQRRRRAEWGEFQHEAVEMIPLKTLFYWGDDMRSKKWTDYGILRINGGKRVKVVVEIVHMKAGSIQCRPKGAVMPLTSKRAHDFRDFCVNMLANYPERISRATETELVQVHHGLEDKHHVFEVRGGDTKDIIHTWGSDSDETT